ncbi:hypothetical protein JCM3765_000052 [Sporobolomyces pararoseus]
MDTLPIYYKRDSAQVSVDRSGEDGAQSRLSFPVSVRSFDSRRESVVPPVPPRPQQWQQEQNEGVRTSRASKRGSVMLLNGPNGLMSGKGGNQQDWMKQFKPLDEQQEEEDAENGEEEQTKTLTRSMSSLFPNSTIDPPARSSSRSPILQQSNTPPSLPPRPPKLSTPSPLAINSNSSQLPPQQELPSPSSSCPPTISPFADMSTSSKPSMGPPPLPARSKSPRFPSSSSSQPSTTTLPTSSSSSSLNFGSSSITAAFNRGLKQTGLRDKFAAGVGFTKEWGGRGKGKLQETFAQSTTNNGGSSRNRDSTSLERGGGLTSSASSPQFETFPSPTTSTTSPNPTTPSASNGSIRLPAVIFDIQVPRVTGVAFGTSLSTLVSSTHLASSLPPRPVSLSPITGDASLLYLPAIAYRCLEYLSEWGLKEEGIYRIPGRSLMVQQLRVLFDAGLGRERECDLRELHPSRLDPNAVASCFKNWLRELPEPLLSTGLESKVDQLTLDHLGYTASSSHFLSSNTTTSSNPPSTTTSPNPENAIVKRGVAPSNYLEELANLFSEEMPAENFYLLRAISYHLSLLASHSEKNKMNLTNLRLILSPTLRLSPGFLLVLVEEREIIFGGINKDAKSRQAATSNLVTPPLLSIPAFPSSSSSSSNPTRSRSPSPQPREQTTPIADKFSFSAIPLAPPPVPPSGAAPPAATAANRIPTRRIDATEGFFSSRNHDHLSKPRSHPTTTVEADAEESKEPNKFLDDKVEEPLYVESEEEEEERKWRERERIKSADLKLSLPEGFEDSLGLGLGFK